MPSKPCLCTPLIALTVFGLASFVHAQTRPSPAPSDAAPTSGAPAPTTPASAEISTPSTLEGPKPAKRVSSSLSSEELNSTITAGFKYHPPQPKPERATPEVDLREIDKPKNKIIRLPKYTVQAERPAIFSERNLYTDKGLADLAAHRYFSAFDRNFLNSHDLFGYNKERVMQTYADEQRQKNMQENDQNVYILRQTGDNDEADRMKKDGYDSYVRPPDPASNFDSDVGTPQGMTRH